ncbi:transcriptional repressor [Primorskyibacter sp. 2E107]|uniref:transcriptional repressor n=1 Tax=Primorskyibacter sp. 2E107 TaxID=3403458 RepID=UPI003AF8768D
MAAKGFARHDHDDCIASGLEAAQTACAAQGLQLTKVRQKTLEILLAQHRAMGAYDVLEQLRDAGLGSQPPVAYRALDFLVTHGFAHRIEQLNAFIACAHPGERHAPVFLICRDCSAVAEAPGRAARDAVTEAAAALGFEAKRVVIEAEGLCPACAQAAA